MPWFEFLPNADERAYWKVGPSTVPKLGMWPSPNSNRVHCGFRIAADPDLIPYSSRYVIEYRGWRDSPAVGDPEMHRMCWVDLDVVTPGVHLKGDAGQDPETLYDLELSIRQYSSLPLASVPGRELRVELEHSQGATATLTLEYRDAFGERLHWNGNWNQHTPIAGLDSSSDEWPYEVNTFEWYPVPECYVFPPQGDQPDPEGFAEFNGIDSYIALDELMDAWSLPFRVTCEFRVRGQPDWMPIMGKGSAGGFFGMDEDDMIWGSLRIDTNWEPDVDVWHTWRLDFEQIGQLGYQMYIDDQAVMDVTTNRQHSNANRLGVYRQGVTGTIWGHFDLRRLKYLKGVSPNFETILDMPLLQNARDAGPKENHGTTFNMDLPTL